MEFGSVPLRADTKQKLAGFFETGQLPHALLLEGGSPSSREKLAFLMAQGAVCKKEGKEFPCGICSGCIKAISGSHPDIACFGGGKGPALRVDEIRRVRHDASIKPNEAQRKIYLLLEAQDMTEQAQNALLKVLEEPPAEVLFLLTAPSSSLLLSTIRSRVQIFRLEEEQAEILPEISSMATDISNALIHSAEAELLYCTAPLIKDKDAFRRTLSLLELLFRDGCVLRAGGTVCISGMENTARELSTAFTRGKLLHMLEVVRQARNELEHNANMALLVSCFCSRLFG